MLCCVPVTAGHRPLRGRGWRSRSRSRGRRRQERRLPQSLAQSAGNTAHAGNAVHTGNMVHILGGVKKAEDIIRKFKVSKQDKSRSRYQGFTSLQDLKKYAERNNMIDVVSHCNFVEQHGPNTGKQLERIRAHVTDADQPHVMVAGTIHQSKGGEWDNVIVVGERKMDSVNA